MGTLWCLRPPPESPVPHKVFVLVKAFGSCHLFAVLFVSVGPSLSFYPLIYKCILKYICQRLSRNPDMFCNILLSTVTEHNQDSARGLRGRSIQNRSWCLFNEQCVYVPPYKNISTPKDTRKRYLVPHWSSYRVPCLVVSTGNDGWVTAALPTG